MIENHKESIKSWEDFFGGMITVVRWDLFEDFLYYISEVALGKYLNLIQNTNWDEYFMNFYRDMAKPCDEHANFKEIPEIPFTERNLVYRGKIVLKDDFLSKMEK